MAWMAGRSRQSRTRWGFEKRMFVLLLMAALAAPAIAQGVIGQFTAAPGVDLSGSWSPVIHEDFPECMPGPELGDYLGLPITDGARLHADSWSHSRLTLQEHQCRVHTSPYIYRGPLQLRIWEEKIPNRKRSLRSGTTSARTNKTGPSGWTVARILPTMQPTPGRVSRQ